MVSFLTNCPDCGNLIAKNSACGNCGSCELAGEAGALAAFATEFGRRQKLHNRNYAIYMTLTMLTGFLAMTSGALWYRLFFGNATAILAIAIIAILALIVGVASRFANVWFPIALHCPACDARVDEVGLDGPYCPSCNILLRK